MAENAANFTSTFQNRPSIFEVIAQKSLNETLYPALQKVALFLSTNFPRKFGFLNLYYDETFSALTGLLQLYYLKYYDASFSENFYGLKRVLSHNEQLKHHERELSLLFLVVMPYFKKKIDDKIQMYKIEYAEGCLTKDFEGVSKRALIIFHSTFEVAWTLLTLNNYLQYMANKTEYQLPLLSILNLKLVYSNEKANASFWGALFKGNLSLSHFNLSAIRTGVSAILETTAFFLQFLETWSAQRPNVSITDLPKVEPPTRDNRANSFQGKCPICHQKWLSPSVLPVSGYVFCFRCIAKYLSDDQRCPITNLPARLSDVMRLYTNGD